MTEANTINTFMTNINFQLIKYKKKFWLLVINKIKLKFYLLFWEK